MCDRGGSDFWDRAFWIYSASRARCGSGSIRFGPARFRFFASLLLDQQNGVLAISGTTLSVLSFGILQGIFLAVLLALIHLLGQTSRPTDAVLGKVPGLDGYNDISNHPDATTIPGLLIYRYDASLLFFNADYFKVRLLRLLQESKEQIRCVLLDFETSAIIDISGADA